MNLNINNEYDKLIKVLIAPVEEKFLPQQKQLIEIFNKYNIKVIVSNKCNGAKYQMFIRDPFIVIGNKLIFSNMKEDVRRLEIDAVNGILNNKNKIYLKENILIEGGDIIIHNDIIFVGQKGNRTNEKGLNFFKKEFEPEYKVIPLNMINPDKNISWVHLDCLFNPISIDTAIIYKDGFDDNTLSIIRKNFKNLIYVSKEEQSQLAVNVFSLGNNTIIMQKRHKRIISLLEENGFNIETMDRYESIDELGYNRCLTCPLERILRK